MSEEQDNNLTYFVFAKPQNGKPHPDIAALAPTRPGIIVVRA